GAENMILMVVNKLRELEVTTGIRLVTTELEIISVLYHEGPVSVQALMGKVRASPSGFHLIKKSMQDTGLIVGCRSAQDARVKLLDLSPDLRESLAAIHRDQTMSTAAPRELAQFAAQIARPVVSEFA
ncbi:MAG: hypothetical protein ACKOW1_05395, partial [Novosphingobium sp.]